MSAYAAPLWAPETGFLLPEREIERLVDMYMWAGKFRPTVVVDIRNMAGQHLMVESAEAIGEWGLVQGGIKPGETVPEAAIREVTEELPGIKPSELAIGPVTEVIRLPANPNHDSRVVFPEGGLYALLSALYSGPGDFLLKKNELVNKHWLDDGDIEGARAILANKRPEKLGLIMRALATGRLYA